MTDITDLRKQLETLYRTHGGKTVGFFRRCRVGDAKSEELAQQTFVLALRSLHQFRGESQMSTWLRQIARRVLLEHLESNEERLASNSDTIDLDDLVGSSEMEGSGSDACVRRGFLAFQLLHPERASIILLAIVEGWTREELAAHLGRTVHAATVYLAQCKAKLKPFIQNCFDED
jgi:RNA polymerase sigma factor (sigma-70 family)